MLKHPCEGSPDILVIAGEASGDEHAAALVRKVLSIRPELRISAIGGPRIEQAGADLLFDLTEHAVVGVFEVLKNYGFFKRLFGETLAWIESNRPKTVLLVDYPGFNLRVADALKDRGISCKGGGEVRLLQYVSPQLWAWKPQRRFKMARILDSLAVIFPFEVDSYDDVDLPVRFVGHPFVSEDYESKLTHASDAPVLLLPGSRLQPVARILPCLIEAFHIVLKESPELKGRIISPSGEVRLLVEKILASRRGVDSLAIVGNEEKISASAVLTSSGTMSLACALAGIPGAIAYRAHPITYLLGRILVKVPYLGMANLLLPENPIYPEFIQGEARPANLAECLHRCLEDPGQTAKAKTASEKLRKLLEQPAELSTSDWLLQEGGLGEATI